MFAISSSVARRVSWEAVLIAGCIGGSLLFAGTAEAQWVDGPRPAKSTLTETPWLSTPVKATSQDPTGDFFPGSEGTAIDLTGLSAEAMNDQLVITLSFSGTISEAGSGAQDAMNGFVDIDVDQNGATGDFPWTDLLRGDGNRSGLGNEAYVDLFTFDSEAGTVEVFDDPNETLIGMADATLVSPRQLEIKIPAAMLGGDTSVSVAALVGNLDNPTDAAPNQGSVSSADPTDGTITLRQGRFALEVTWNTTNDTGSGQAATLSDDSAVVWFFEPNNWEMLVKVLDGCTINDKYWVFFAATTDVGFTLRVTDTQNQTTRTYSSMLGQEAVSVNDTEAFACP